MVIYYALVVLRSVLNCAEVLNCTQGRPVECRFIEHVVALGYPQGRPYNRTITSIVPTIKGVNDMRETFGLIVIAALPVSPIIIIVVGLVLAVAVLIGAFLLFRSSGKSKKGGTAASGGGSADWQRQQQPGTMNSWNPQGTGAQADNSPWGQAGQQQQGWGTPGQGQGQGQGQGFGQQQQSATPWATQGSTGSPQQPASPWGAQGSPGSPQQQQPASPWGAQGMGSQPSWDATQAASQDPWAQAAPAQQGQPQSTPAWGMQSTPSVSQQQAPTAFGGAGAGPTWGQPAQQAQPAQPADPWAQPQSAQQGWGQGFQQQSQQPSTPSSGSPPLPSWQQSGQGQGQQQQGFGTGTPASSGFGGMGLLGGARPETASPFASNDADKTVVRPGSGLQGGMPGVGPQAARIGIVRVKEGKEPGKTYEVRKESLSIGRSRESDIFLEDLAVSRLHASIVNLGDGNYALRDEGSANGTKVNNQTVNKFQNYPLQEGDEIQLGQTVLVFAKR